MATTTIYCSECRYGIVGQMSGFSNSGQLQAGLRSGNTYDVGCITFTIPSDIKNSITKINSIYLKIKRTDNYADHKLIIGCTTSTSNTASLTSTISWTVTSGKNEKTVDIINLSNTILNYSGTFYLQIRHGSGSSWTTFDGGNTSASRPRLVIDYEDVPNIGLSIDECNFVRCNSNGGSDGDIKYIKCTKLKLSMNQSYKSYAACSISCEAIENNTGQASNNESYTYITTELDKFFTTNGYIETGTSYDTPSERIFKLAKITNVSYKITVRFYGTGTYSGQEVIRQVIVSTAQAKLHIAGYSSGGIGIGQFSTATANHPKFEVASDHESFFYGGIYGVTNYTEGEVDTGGKWIDGKPIYRYIITLGAIASGGKKSYELPSVVENIISFSGIRHLANGMISTLPYVSTSSFAYTAEFRVETDRKTLTVYIGSSTSMDHGYIILEYTKSATAADPTDPEGPQIMDDFTAPDTTMARTDYIAMMTGIEIPTDTQPQQLSIAAAPTTSAAILEQPTLTTLHFQHYDQVLNYYKYGCWNETMVNNAIGKWITTDEAQSILAIKKINS